MAFNVTLPQIIIEAALTPSVPVPPAGTLTLDSATAGILGTDFLAGGNAWTDITQWVTGFTVTRPSSRVQGPLLQYQASTASITLNNADGRFDPDNLAGPYVVAGVSQVHSMVPVRIRAVFNNVAYPLFAGFADGWQETAVTFAGGTSEWTLAATDGFKALAGITLPTLVTPVGAHELTGARINRILDAAGWYSWIGDGARKIEAGNSPLQATTLGDTPLNLMQLASDSEIGQLYIDGTGAVVFRQRQALAAEARSNTSQATFGDLDPGIGNGEFPCASIGRADDDTTIGNDIQATVNGSSNMQEVMNAASVALYLFPRTYARSDLILLSDTDALNWANWVLFISEAGEDRFDTVSVDPAAQPLDLWPQVLGRDIGDRITVNRRPPGVSVVTRQGFISGVTHTFDTASSQWLTTWTLQDASKYGNFLLLNNATLGKLNNNALGF